MLLDPFAVIEGTAIAAYAIGASEAFIAVRSEDADVIARLSAAIGAATDAGFVGEDVSGSGHDIFITVRPVQGAYMLGEETVLLKALEGKRGQPEQRPPHPAERGLFDRPTLVHNVQTLAAVPWIVREGADAFRATGTSEQPGHRPRAGPDARRQERHRRGPARDAAERRPRASAASCRPAGTIKAVLDRRPVRRAAAPGCARHALRLRAAARGRRPSRLGLRRGRRRHGPTCSSSSAC